MKFIKISRLSNKKGISDNVLYAFIFVYGAAGLSFLATLLRDYFIIGHANNASQFFQLFYVASMSAGFAVNALTLGKRLPVSYIAILAVVSICICLILVPKDQYNLSSISWVILIQFLWIIGAFWARIAIERNFFFLGRSRETVTSLATVPFIVAGFTTQSSFIYAVIIGTLFSLVVYRMAIKLGPESEHNKNNSDSESSGRADGYVRFIENIALSNVASFIITWWALKNTEASSTVFGIESTVAIRVSLYVYQTITIGAIVFAVRRYESIGTVASRNIGAVALASVLGGVFLPLEVSVVILPLAAGVAHYSLVIYLQRNRDRGGYL